jgi:hypothetical protein
LGAISARLLGGTEVIAADRRGTVAAILGATAASLGCVACSVAANNAGPAVGGAGGAGFTFVACEITTGRDLTRPTLRLVDQLHASRVPVVRAATLIEGADAGPNGFVTAAWMVLNVAARSLETRLVHDPRAGPVVTGVRFGAWVSVVARGRVQDVFTVPASDACVVGACVVVVAAFLSAASACVVLATLADRAGVAVVAGRLFRRRSELALLLLNVAGDHLTGSDRELPDAVSIDATLPFVGLLVSPGGVGPSLMGNGVRTGQQRQGDEYREKVSHKFSPWNGLRR